MNHWLYTQAQNRPHHIALKSGETELTFQQLYRHASMVSHQLSALELPKRIAIQPTNGHHYSWYYTVGSRNGEHQHASD